MTVAPSSAKSPAVRHGRTSAVRLPADPRVAVHRRGCAHAPPDVDLRPEHPDRLREPQRHLRPEHGSRIFRAYVAEDCLDGALGSNGVRASSAAVAVTV